MARPDQESDPREGVGKRAGIIAPPGVGPETRSLLSALQTLLEGIVDAQFDSAVILDPRAFATTRNAEGTNVTPGRVKELYTNHAENPVAIHVRVEAAGSGYTNYLILDNRSNTCTRQQARIVKFGEAPEVQFILLSGETMYIDATNGDGSGNAVSVTFVAIPLRGRRGAVRS